MANKESTIKTIFALDGETKYKDAIKGINSEQRELQSELKKADAAYKLNGDKVEYNKSKVEILNKQYDLQKKKVDETKHAMEQSIKVHGENSAETQKLRTEYNKAETQLMKYEKQLNDVTAELAKQEEEAKKLGNTTREMGDKLQASGAKMKGVGDNMSKFVSGPIAAIGAAATAAFVEVDNSLDSIATATGATGGELKGLQKVWEDVVRTMPVDMDKASDAVGELNTQFGWTGDKLDEATRLSVKFAEISGSDVVGSVQGAKKALEIFGLEADDYGRLLEIVAKKSQDTGVDTKRMFDAIQKGGPILRDLGIPLEESVTLIAQMEQHGVDATRTVGYLARAQSTLAKEGKTLNEGLSDFQEFVRSGASETDKMTEAAELFGTKGAVVMLDAVSRGVMDFDALAEASEGASGTISRTFEETLDPIDRHKELLNNAKIAGAELSENIQIAMAPAMEGLIDLVSGAVDGFQGLDEGQQDFIIKAGLVTAAIGPVLSVGGRMVETIGKGVGHWGNLIDKLSMAPGVMGDVVTSLGSAGTAGLIGAVALAGIAVYGVVKEILKVDPAVKAAREALDGMKDSGTNAAAELMATSEQISFYRDELDTLMDVQDKDAATKARISDVVQRLNQLMPELNLSYDEQADKLNKTTIEMDALTDATLRRIYETLKADMLAEMMEKEKGLLEDLVRKQKDLAIAQEAQQKIEEALNQARLTGLSDYDIRMAQSSKAVQDHNGWTKELSAGQVAAIEELNDVMDTQKRRIETYTDVTVTNFSTATHAVNDLGVQMGLLEPVIDDLKDVAGGMGERFDENNQIIDEVAGQLGILGDKTKEASDAVEDGSTKMAGSISDSVDNIEDDLDRFAEAMDMSREEAEEHYKKLEDLSESNKNQMNRFTKERFDYEKGTKDEFLKMWEKEVIAFQEYEDNLKTIASKVGPDVAEELRKLGPEAAPLIQQFVDGTDEEMSRLKTVVQSRTEAARKAAAAELGLMADDGYKAGANFGDSIAKGINSKVPTVTGAGKGVGAAAGIGAKQAMVQKSPSKVGLEIGANFGSSIGMGVESEIDRVKKSGKELAEELIEATRLSDPLIKAELAAAARVSASVVPMAAMHAMGGGSVNNVSDVVNISVEVPPGASEDFGRRVGQAVADQLRAIQYGRGK